MPDDEGRKVGYGQPPTKSRFRKGQSGNPKGRPKGAKNFATVLSAELNGRIAVSENGKRRKITRREAIAKQLVNRAVSGDPKALPILFNETRSYETDLAASPVASQARPEDRAVMDGILSRLRAADAARTPPAEAVVEQGDMASRTPPTASLRACGRELMLSPEDYQFILRSDFVSFNERAFYELNPQAPFKPAPHIEAIATKLEACRRGEVRRLIINLPPRHLKSHTASIAFVAWYLGQLPAGQVICASYGQDLAD